MQRRAGQLIFSPGDLCRFFESPFASWMDRLRVERPGTEEPDEGAPELKLLADMGKEHEKRHLAALRAAGKSVWEPPSELDTFERRHEATLAAMRAGHDVIYQGALCHGDFAGYADFLYRVETPSRFGAWSYDVADTKLARNPKPYFLLQLCAYAKMLEHLQGVRPERLLIVNGASEEVPFRTDDYFFYFAALERRFLEAQRSFSADERPVPDARADHGRWQGKADAILEEMDHPCRVAGITVHQINRLRDAGITTLSALASTNVERVAKLDPAIFRRLRAQARLQRDSSGKVAPLYELVREDSEVARHGLALLPPASEMDVYFDMEGYPLLEGGLEYLFGATVIEAGAPSFRDFWGHDRLGEKSAFEAFVDWLYARYLADPSMHVFHYGGYEVTALRRLMGQHGTRETEIDALLRAELFVDLYRVVTQAIRIGEPRYSLKNVEHLYRPARAGEVATAAQSVVEYARWIEQRDGDTWESSAILAGIRDYNRDDCESTWGLRTWLSERQREEGIAYIPPPRKGAEREAEPDPVRTAADALAERLLEAIPLDRTGDPERWRLQELLAHLVGFHRREANPVWWKMFDRRDKSHALLVEDGDCLGAVERTDTPKIPIKQSLLYEYRFDPNQDTKLGEGSKCFITEGLVPTTIERFDGDAGVLQIKLGRKQPEPPPLLSLIPSEYVDAKKIAASIATVAQTWEQTGRLPPALDTFLRRAPPRVTGVTFGSPLLGGTPDEVTVTSVIAALNDSAIAVQGPPGAGKTRTAAAAIVKLASRGRRVGISSNSHKAIQKLIEEVQKKALPGIPKLRITKINRDADDELVAKGLVRGAKSMTDVDFDAPDAPQIVGGTAWAFADPSAAGRFHTLFVDEAGQVSVANLVGMAPAGRSLVLLGDQMQLGQPIQGSHPGESGQSALEYLLRDHRTIPASLGIFLGTTWRLHPDLCRFISGAVYDDKLHAESSAASRIVRRGAGVAGLVGKEAGIVFVPVVHEGNGQASEEEVETIVAIVRELRGRELTGTSGERAKRSSALDENDLLVVAPYNAQVRALRAALPNVRVGSVDKFQGQEAPVVIVSMCASSGDASPRGIEFLFSPNRLNVALSRAQSLAILVGCPELAGTRVRTVPQMKLVNLFCRIVEEGG